MNPIAFKGPRPVGSSTAGYSLLEALLWRSSAADYCPDTKVPLTMQEVVPKLERPLLIDPDSTIPRAIEVVFGSSPSRRYALVHSSFTPDAFYYNTWASLPRLACISGWAP